VILHDVDGAEAEVLDLGAEPLTGGDRVFVDPAGYPFCLVMRPSWAPPSRMNSPRARGI
jgi:hypothetical protein